MVIYKPDTAYLTVLQAVELLRQALPKEPGGDVFATITESGEIDWDGPIEVKYNEQSNIRSEWLEQDFSTTCQILGLRPRNLYRPNITDFTWDAHRPSYYTITHEEFVRYAAHYHVDVVVGEKPQAVPNVANEATTPDLTKLATRKELIDAFGRFTGMNEDWFNNLTDSPALNAARKVKGKGHHGSTIEPLFCPFEVMQWLAGGKRKKGRPLSKDKAWELLERYFPRVYLDNSIGDPRTDR